eukprot:1444590-Rhodomonas_salina.1
MRFPSLSLRFAPGVLFPPLISRLRAPCYGPVARCLRVAPYARAGTDSCVRWYQWGRRRGVARGAPYPPRLGRALAGVADNVHARRGGTRIP